MQKIEYCLKRNSCPYVIIHKKKKSPIIIISNKWQLSGYRVSFRKMTKYHITKLGIDMKGTYKTLAHPHIRILAVWSNKTDFIFVSRFHLYCPVIIWCIRNKITTVFWPDDGINYFFNIVHWILRLDGLIVERDIIVDYSKFVWTLFLRREPAMTSPITWCLSNDTCFFYLWEDAVTKLAFFFSVMKNFWYKSQTFDLRLMECLIMSVSLISHNVLTKHSRQIYNNPLLKFCFSIVSAILSIVILLLSNYSFIIT